MRMGRMTAILCLASLLSGNVLAQGKIAVLNLEEAIFNTEEAKAQFAALQQTSDFVDNRKRFEELKKRNDELVEQFNKNREVMSAEQQEEQAKAIKDVRADLEFVGNKLQQSQREVAQRVMRELGPAANQIVLDLVKAEGIGLLLNAQAALYADTAYDINAKVTDKLNQRKK